MGTLLSEGTDGTLLSGVSAANQDDKRFSMHCHLLNTAHVFAFYFSGVLLNPRIASLILEITIMYLIV